MDKEIKILNKEDNNYKLRNLFELHLNFYTRSKINFIHFYNLHTYMRII